MIELLPLPDDLRPLLDDARLRRLRGVFVQRSRNALVNEIMSWNGAGKPGEGAADLSLRDGLKGRSLKAAGEGKETTGRSKHAAPKRPKPAVTTVPLVQFYPPAAQQQEQLQHEPQHLQQQEPQQQPTLGPGAALHVALAPPTAARRVATEPKAQRPCCTHQCSSCTAPQRKNGQHPTACSKCKGCCLRDRSASNFNLRCVSHVAGMKKAAVASATGAVEAAAGPAAQ